MLRRNFLLSGAALLSTGLINQSMVPAMINAAANRSRSGRKPGSCILLYLRGGPSQLETFDPKPMAAAEVRGPFRAISTRVPGICLSETLPELAQRADQFAIVRTLTWDGPALHEAGHEILMTGATGRFPLIPDLTTRLNRVDVNSCSDLPAVILTPRQGEAAVSGGTFRSQCKEACQLIESGRQLVTVCSHAGTPGELNWDCHADGRNLPTTLRDYKNFICADFDAGCTALLDHLERVGLLQETLVVAVGEFGRTARINCRGGRDHSTGVWSALLAGAGIQGGTVLGESDPLGSQPLHSPVSPADLHLLMATHLGLTDGKSCAVPSTLQRLFV